MQIAEKMKTNIIIRKINKSRIRNEVPICMLPSAKVFPLKPRSVEMLSSGSLTTLIRQNKNIKIHTFHLMALYLCKRKLVVVKKKRHKEIADKSKTSRQRANPIW